MALLSFSLLFNSLASAPNITTSEIGMADLELGKFDVLELEEMEVESEAMV